MIAVGALAVTISDWLPADPDPVEYPLYGIADLQTVHMNINTTLLDTRPDWCDITLHSGAPNVGEYVFSVQGQDPGIYTEVVDYEWGSATSGNNVRFRYTGPDEEHEVQFKVITPY